jgi:hypothetical protein
VVIICSTAKTALKASRAEGERDVARDADKRASTSL